MKVKEAKANEIYRLSKELEKLGAGIDVKFVPSISTVTTDFPLILMPKMVITLYLHDRDIEGD